MKFIGAHVSAAGGVENAPKNAAAIGATAFGLFTKNQRQWTAKPLTAESIKAFKIYCLELGFSTDRILPHDSYLVNLAHPEDAKLEKSRLAFLDEMQRREQLGLACLNVHPGNHLNRIEESTALKRVAASLDGAIEQTNSVIAVIEMTAGQGGNLGYSLPHLARILEAMKHPERAGVCIDTAHAYAAGYDLKTESGYDEFWREFERILGMHRLCGVHVNDSLKPLGSRVDRHAGLGDGELGWEVFSRIMRDQRLDAVPLILETPNPERRPREIQQLKSFYE